ncbi:MAG: glycosyl hydrolase [Thermoguttaceae bacterium]
MQPLARILIIATLCGCLIAASGLAADPATATAGLDQRFQAPHDADKPWAYWWWINGNVDKPTITHDLEQMKEKGFAGLLMFDARGYHDDHCPPPPPRMEFMSPEWRELVRFAISEASRVGLEMSINLSSCAGALKGPWLVEADAPKHLVWTSAQVTGPRELNLELAPSAEAYHQEIALFALKSAGAAESAEPADQLLSGNWRQMQPKLDANSAADEVVDISDRVDDRGRLTWTVPTGDWTLIRFAYAAMAGHEYDVDVLDAKAVAGHFDRMGKRLLEDAGPAAGKTLTHFYSVSWEGAAPTWTGRFEQQFEKYRGYSPRKYLPILAGKPVASSEVCERFLRDYYKTLGDMFRDNFYGQLQASCHERGLKWHSESGGPWTRDLAAFHHADQLAFLARNDMPQGEFWHLGRAMNRPPAMTAHVYGKPLAAVEAFTHMRQHWSAYPAVLKPDADAAFVDGANQFIWHTFSCSPPEFGKPGIEYFAGTHVNPNVTWFHQVGPFLTYLARCQLMLRQGLFAADVCCYTGDKTYMHWGRGEKWSEKGSLVLGKGYTYDLVNDEVLLERMSVQDGKLVLPDGMSYRVLAVDLEDQAVPPKTLAKIAELAKAGATVVLGARRPTHAPGLESYPGCDDQVRLLAEELWGKQGSRALGKGKIVSGKPIDDVVREEGILPDFEGPFQWIHRQAGQADIYFVSGSGAGDAVFRTGDKEPELWCPRTGAVGDAVAFRATGDGRTIVPLALPEGGSVFVVFRKPAQSKRLTALPDPAVRIVDRTTGGVKLEVWDNQKHALALAAAEKPLEPAGRPEPQDMAGPWEVAFSAEWGAPASITFDRLIPWNEHSNEAIKYYSGTATYRKTLSLTAEQVAGLVRLQLGKVGHVADVRLNGKSLGIAWCEPWSVDLTGAVRQGENQLEIVVANLWMNRLIGDSTLPPEKRQTRANIRFFKATDKYRVFEGYSPKDPLAPSGLIGPVRLQFGKQLDVSL